MFAQLFAHHRYSSAFLLLCLLLSPGNLPLAASSAWPVSANTITLCYKRSVNVCCLRRINHLHLYTRFLWLYSCLTWPCKINHLTATPFLVFSFPPPSTPLPPSRLPCHLLDPTSSSNPGSDSLCIPRQTNHSHCVYYHIMSAIRRTVSFHTADRPASSRCLRPWQSPARKIADSIIEDRPYLATLNQSFLSDRPILGLFNFKQLPVAWLVFPTFPPCTPKSVVLDSEVLVVWQLLPVHRSTRLPGQLPSLSSHPHIFAPFSLRYCPS